MGDVVNLRRFRKRRSREDAARRAEENRANHGQSGAVRKLRKAEEEMAARRLDAHRRDTSGEKPDDSA